MSTIDKLEVLAQRASSVDVLYHVVQYTDRDKRILGLSRFVRYGVLRTKLGHMPEHVAYFCGSKSVREYFFALEKNLASA